MFKPVSSANKKKKLPKKWKRRFQDIVLLVCVVLIFRITPWGASIITYINTPYSSTDTKSSSSGFSSLFEWPDYSSSNTTSNTTKKENDNLSLVNSFESDATLLTLEVVDVEQGSCSLIIFPDGKSLLIDTGYYEYVDNVRQALKSAGVTTLDALIITHPHSDHDGSAATIIRDYVPAVVYTPTVLNQTITTSSHEEMEEAIAETNVEVEAVAAGDTILSSDLYTVTVISPSSTDAQYDDLNDFSIGVIIRYGNSSFLIDGDATTVSESEMLSSNTDLDVDVLVVPHHGSSSSSSSQWLAEVTPAIACISVGADNEYGHPTEQTLSNLERYTDEIYCTSDNGNIYIETDGISYALFPESGQLDKAA